MDGDRGVEVAGDADKDVEAGGEGDDDEHGAAALYEVAEGECEDADGDGGPVVAKELLEEAEEDAAVDDLFGDTCDEGDAGPCEEVSCGLRAKPGELGT